MTDEPIACPHCGRLPPPARPDDDPGPAISRGRTVQQLREDDLSIAFRRLELRALSASLDEPGAALREAADIVEQARKLLRKAIGLASPAPPETRESRRLDDLWERGRIEWQAVNRLLDDCSRRCGSPYGLVHRCGPSARLPLRYGVDVHTWITHQGIGFGVQVPHGHARCAEETPRGLRGLAHQVETCAPMLVDVLDGLAGEVEREIDAGHVVRATSDVGSYLSDWRAMSDDEIRALWRREP